MSMHYLIIIFLLSLLSCGNQGKTEQNTFFIKDKLLPLDKINDTNKIQPKVESDSSLIFLFENDTLIQKVKIKYVSDKEIYFILTSSNKQKKSSAKIEGLAKRKSEADPEIDEDEEGNAYPAQQYIYEKACWLSLRIEMEGGNKLRIVEGNCEKYHEVICPFGSIGILRAH